ncbi:aldehyde dehydrogenase EutE [candidate division KSB3 bacterium]|uniref:Aldehyde dehydrogenase EutE n=1 Tax=candidate division KSB3 bacterium TaxID=2044937 RepID=A0A2G6E3D4_9BACT|nr:MAG: aldehyde dehydrogenase EutE [candidate division KSB3 bacterium]PIE29038.1 MAG: aldehyde dehydrogenase EutE [candidate division KSB3 bacterium]
MIHVKEEEIRRLVETVVENLDRASLPGLQAEPQKNAGIFSDIEQAISAAETAHHRLMALSLASRSTLISAMRQAVEEHNETLAKRACEETGRGYWPDKVLKNHLVGSKTPGTEDLEALSYSDDHGLTLVERAPYGVIGAIIPVTNPSSTVINNGISMIAGGNAVVFNPHPSAKRVSCLTISLLNEAIVTAGGPPNLLTAIADPSIESAQALMRHPRIRLLVVTGGPAVVKAAMNSGKKVIAAGPGNPPCVVDESADIEKAGRDIVQGAGFDRNIICICEKEILAVASIADRLKQVMTAHGAFELNREQSTRLTELVISKAGGPGTPGVPNKDYVGKSPAFIAAQIGLSVPDSTRILLCETEQQHPLVWTEQLMPVLPLVRMPHVDDAIDLAFQCEHGFRHTAVMHSLHVAKLSKMARTMNCSIFVKNGPAYSGLGQGGAGFSSFTIASPTGEGLTRARTFTRERRCTLVEYFRIV